jgi:hypothetical protein
MRYALEIILEKHNQTVAFPCHEVIKGIVGRLVYMRYCDSLDELLSFGLDDNMIEK